MSRIDNLRWIFSDYSDSEIILNKWSVYSFHVHESSLRSISDVESKLSRLAAGTYNDTQAWRDLRSVYGLTTELHAISTIGQQFLAFCSTAPSDFAKEFWLYRQLVHATDDLRIFQLNRIKNMYKLLYSIPNHISRFVLDGSDRNDRILAFAEHLIPFTDALNKLFALPLNDLYDLVTFTDTQHDSIKASFLSTEANLKKLESRINTYNRAHYKRRIAIVSAMLIPVVDRINYSGSAPFRVTAPFNSFFTREQINRLLADLNFQVQVY